MVSGARGRWERPGLCPLTPSSPTPETLSGGWGQPERRRPAWILQGWAEWRPPLRRICTLSRISGNAASDKNIKDGVCAQIEKNFARAKWKVRLGWLMPRAPSGAYSFLPVSLTGVAPPTRS